MATRPTLPYYAPSDSIPAPIPTAAEIIAVPRPGKTPPVLFGIIRFGEHYLVKYGQTVSLQEGENMLFVKQSTKISIPTVYALFHDEDTGSNFIVMEYVHGRTLHAAWGGLDRAAKETVAAQLRRHLDELRSLPSPGYYGGVWEQPVHDGWLARQQDADTERDPLLLKPTNAEKDWVEALVRATQAVYPLPPKNLEWFRRLFHLGLTCASHIAVFTHADLHTTNILLRDDGTIVLIDWEMSGWYPSYWEYCRAMLGPDSMKDFAEWVPVFLDEHLRELGWMWIFRFAMCAVP